MLTEPTHRLLRVAALLLLVLAWLVPNHDLPWTTFWSDALAALAFVLLLIPAVPGLKGAVPVPRVALVGAGLALVPLFQGLAGRIHFGGDAWMACLYLLGWALAVTLPALQQQALDDWLDGLAWAFLIGALASAGLAGCQWLGLDGWGLYMVGMPVNGRPYANLAQPNQLATLLMLGLIAACMLYQRRHLGAVSLTLLVLVLCFAAVMTQSRTAWVELAGLGAWVLFVRDRAGLRLSRGAMVGIAAYFIFLVLVWPALCDALQLPSRQTLRDASPLGVGLRGQHWLAMLEAMGREFWWGHGWNQVSVAQFHVAAQRPPVGEMIEHSHNMALDLLVWNGVPLGALVLGYLVWWFWAHGRACRDARVAWLLASVGVVVLHGLLEFPLEYAYFLLPVGFMMGAMELLSPAGRFARVPKPAVLAASALAVLLLAWTLVEYISVEAYHRELRFELAGYGPAKNREQMDSTVLLTQLREFQRFARTQARRGMTAQELDWMRKVAQRYGYPPVLFRYALAAALNGEPETAERVLTLLCHIHPPARCLEGLDAWGVMATGAYPELKDVALPVRPPPPPQVRQ